MSLAACLMFNDALEAVDLPSLGFLLTCSALVGPERAVGYVGFRITIMSEVLCRHASVGYGFDYTLPMKHVLPYTSDFRCGAPSELCYQHARFIFESTWMSGVQSLARRSLA